MAGAPLKDQKYLKLKIAEVALKMGYTHSHIGTLVYRHALRVVFWNEKYIKHIEIAMLELANNSMELLPLIVERMEVAEEEIRNDYIMRKLTE